MVGRMRRELERLAAEGDFDGFYRAQYVRLVRALLLLTGDAGEAEDLAQEALSRVYERWERVSAMDSSEGYLFRTALNLHRKRARRLRIGARAEASAGTPNVDEASIDDRLTVLAAVAKLTRGQREALVLVEWLGFDATEAGEILGIRPVSVRSRLMDARRNLRRRLGGIDG